MMQNNKKIAITGGIGSGKSTVAEIISELGFKVVSCDEIYKQLLNEDDFLNILSAEFGDISDVYGKLDRKKLSSIVFSDKQKLKRLNEITHPLILEEAFKRVSGDRVAFCEVPLLFEGGYENLFDGVIVVLRDKITRLNSVAKRDGKNEKEVSLRINSQINYDNLSFEMYYVIHNDSNLNDLRTQTIKIIDKIIE